MRKITISKPIYELYKELERLEELLDFSVFYPLERAFESHHFLPGFHVDKVYYEIHEDDKNNLIVLQFGKNALLGDEGYEVEGKYLEELIETLKAM